MGKFEESLERQNAEALDLGMENAKILQQATNWCKHFRAEMQSAGLLAQMSGLPIGLVEISCQYAELSSAGMNLPSIVPSFIIENCAGCPDHEPNGDVSWGEAIIEKHERQFKEHKQTEQVRQEQLRAVRERLRELPRQAKENAKLNERQILTYIEELFSEDEEQQEETAKLLIQAARIGADLFSEIAINILIEQSLYKAFGLKCLPICAELAGQRKDLSSRFTSLALTAIEQSVYPELASGILIRLGETVKFPISTPLIENLIGHQNHNILFYLPGREPSYPNSTRVLTLCYEADPSSVIEPFRSRLRCDNKHIRIDACGVLKLLQSECPQLGLDLLPELVDSLELDDDHSGGSADEQTKGCIGKALCHAPLHVDEYLVSAIRQKRPAVQEEIVDVYCMVVQSHARNWREEPHKLTAIRVEEQISVNRCLEFVKDEFFDLDVRYKAAECLESTCDWCPEAAIFNFDLLLGYYALICTQDESPPPLPRIILPGQKTEDPRIASLNEEERRQKWGLIKSNLLKTLEKLAEHKPKAIGETVISCYENLATKNNKKFKSALLNLLAKAGKEYSLQPQVLPVLMDGLMDFESQLIRASAIQAVEEMYRYSKSDPPKNIVDILIVHLRDSYVIVHKAAIHAFRWHGSWFNQEQAVEALNLMICWLDTYKKKPHDLDDIAEAMLNTTRRFAHLKNIAIQHIAAALPTNEALVDQRILEDMLQCVDPNESTAVIVACQIGWCLANYDRKPHNSYKHSKRAKMFAWLHELPHAIYKSVQSELFESAQKLAKKDAWEACYFASLFAKHDDYSAEKEILRLAASSLKQEKKYSKFQAELEKLEMMAATNHYLQDGNLKEAYLSLSKIRGTET
ncbi:MAG: hypothetical protein KME19_03545 [Microcoleus vaginatus WJT46-NPBG5]|jgi:hypothetical protein|nr:hypothetical protein [Microcoleus vaginatus WJT46-NPBG5]